jgi:cytochrome c-type biogenesis protein CcmH/NrfG
MGLPTGTWAGQTVRLRYRRALALEPSRWRPLQRRGVYAYDVKDYKRAITVWEQLLRLAPNYPDAEVMRAAIAKFKKALKKEDQ